MSVVFVNRRKARLWNPQNPEHPAWLSGSVEGAGVRRYPSGQPWPFVVVKSDHDGHSYAWVADSPRASAALLGGGEPEDDPRIGDQMTVYPLGAGADGDRFYVRVDAMTDRPQRPRKESP